MYREYRRFMVDISTYPGCKIRQTGQRGMGILPTLAQAWLGLGLGLGQRSVSQVSGHCVTVMVMVTVTVIVTVTVTVTVTDSPSVGNVETGEWRVKWTHSLLYEEYTFKD